MDQILKSGQKVRTSSSRGDCTVEKLLGKPVALKWYYPTSATPDQQKALEALIKIGAPSDRFLWPMQLATASATTGFGYVMPLRNRRFRSIVDLMKRRIEPSFRALATAGLELSHSYLQLHAKGLCYRDISFGNAFFDPDTGEILICDNDNVAIDNQSRSPVYGTPRFMAPEIVRGDAVPGTQTDLFSLAVLLFYMFVMHHPLEGRKELTIKCLDLPAMKKLYGTEPLFIFDPSDNSNAPDPQYQRNALAFWTVYPRFLRDLFTKAFTDGIRDPQHGRVRESNWRAVMVRLRDSIVYCTHCNVENFHDGGEDNDRCWSCRRQLRLPPRVRIGKIFVMLNHDTFLFAHHVDEEKKYDFTHPVAAVTKHPVDPEIWGLKNLSLETWSTTNNKGEVKDVSPGRSVTLALGTRINFGHAEGEIWS